MSYKNDHLLVIANKYGKSSGDAKAELYETWDKIRDLTVTGPAVDGSGFGLVGKTMLGLARYIAPGSFMAVLGGPQINIPGTSYSQTISGGNSITSGAQSAFGFGNLGNYPGFPGGAAPINQSAIGTLGMPILSGIGGMLSNLASSFTIGGMQGVVTGGAASNAIATASGLTGGGIAGFKNGPSSFIVPTAGVVAGVGQMVSALGPYFGPFGLIGGLAGNMMSAYSGAVLNEYQQVTGRIINNADTILAQRVKNIETVCKQLDTQGDLVRKMLKDSMDGDSKAIQSI